MMETETIENEKNEETAKSWTLIMRQLVIMLSILSFCFLFGLALGSPTVLVPQLLKKANSTSAVSEEMASWITSIIPVAGMFWMFILLLMTHKYGRKKPAIFVSLTSTCGFAVFYSSKNVMDVFYSQLIQGILNASSVTVGVMMLLEYTTPKYRGMLMAAKYASYSWGIWVSNTIGTFVDYKFIGILGMTFAIMIFVIFVIMPESPFWLASQQRHDECVVAHRWLMGSGDMAEKELNTLLDVYKDHNVREKSSFSIKGQFHDLKDFFKRPEIYKPFLLCLFLPIILQISGKPLCAVYGFEVLNKILGSESFAYKTMLIVDFISICGMYAGVILLKFCKRRLLLIGACLICTFFSLSLALYKYLISLSIVSLNNNLMLTLLIGYNLSACVGPTVTTSALFAELFPKKHRTLLIGIYCFFSKFYFSVALKLGLFLFRTLQVWGAFTLFGIGLILCMIVIFKYLPETRNQSTQEMVHYFRGEKSVRNTELNKLFT